MVKGSEDKGNQGGWVWVKENGVNVEVKWCSAGW